MWQHLAEHCRHEGIELHVIGISKGNIIELTDLKPSRGATDLVKGLTQRSGGKPPLDIVIQQAHARHQFDRVIIAFDLWAPNQEIPAEDRKLPCPMRPEVAFVLAKLVGSKHLDAKFKRASQALLGRYQSRNKLQPRAALSEVEVLFMSPMFEAIFVDNEALVRTVLKSLSRPGRERLKDWPKFKTLVRALDKFVLDPAIESATGRRNAYSSAKSHWGLTFVKAAERDSALWDHPIATRLCRVLCP
jgi:hypothetical protein